MKQFDSLAQVYQYATCEYSSRRANMMSDGKGGYTYNEFRNVCNHVSDLLSSYGIGSGDKVALLSGSTPNWSLAFFATVAFGRVSVPILPDFSENEVSNVLSHSESKALFISDRLLGKVSEQCRKQIHLIIDINTLKPIFVDGQPVEPTAMGSQSAELTTPGPDSLAALIYTSGTTGKAKGVMLSHRNFTNNIAGAYNFHAITPEDVFLSVLPLAHTYELSIGLIYPFAGGACVAYMTKKPTPSALKEAMPIVRPTTMLTVPLIIEKVYKGVVIPKVRKSKTLSWMNKHANKMLCKMAGKEILRYFGGRLKFFGIGGAPLDKDVESFLYKARFPYYIGYGLTECAPMLTGCSFKNTRPGCIGYPFLGMDVKLHNVNPETGEGEIVAKGPNVMMGYYKDPERTKEAFTEDGYFRTNDLASVDEKGRFRIRGRLNNMILGPSGENIYPEEIEKVIKDEDGVAEAIVIQRNKSLIALIELSDGVIEDINKFKHNILDKVNSKVSTNSKIGEVQIMKEPFIKTATQKIRRFLYKDSAPTLEDKNENGKTNAARLLDAAGIEYELVPYSYSEEDLSAESVAAELNEPIEQVFKTLVLRGDKTKEFVCVIPGDMEVDLKVAAKISGNKNCEMLHVKDLLPTTGYIRGGCSPIGMKKPFPTFIHESALLYDYIYISAGKRGLQIKINPQALIDFVKMGIYPL